MARENREKSGGGLSPAEVRERLPFAPVLTSAGLGWPEHVVAERFLGLDPTEVEVAAEGYHRLVFLNTRDQCLRVHCAWDGLDGRVEHDVKLCPGDERPFMAFVPAGRPHGWDWRGGHLDSRVVLLSIDCVEAAAQRVGVEGKALELRDDPCITDAKLAGLQGTLFGHLERPSPTLGGTPATLVAEAMASWLVSTHHPHHHHPRRRTGPRRAELSASELRALRALVTRRLDEAIAVPELAAEVGLSSIHFARVFRATVHTTPSAFVREVRVMAAADLLRSGRCGPSEAAMRCGFSDQSHLGRVINKSLGLTPGTLARCA